ncbi:MAG: hypothetical protein MI892_22755, partial [Desulfobacterales bacterium]|nr:hypothetical protein [Desulfobacterales bacterium]
MKQVRAALISFVTLLAACGGSSTDYTKAMKKAEFSAARSAPSGNDAISGSTNMSDKKAETEPKLNAYEGAGFIKPPVINNYGTVSLSYSIDVPGGRSGVQPAVAISYSSSGGDGLCGIGWSLSTGLGVISRTTQNGPLYYDSRDTFTFNGKRLIKVAGPADSEDGTYRMEIESGFSKFVLTNADQGGVWTVHDKAGNTTVFGEIQAQRVYHPEDAAKTYIWNFTRTSDLNGNYMYAVYDDSEYSDKRILYLKEIHYTGNSAESFSPKQYVKFTYKKRDHSYVSKTPGFVMEMDRLLDKIEVGYDGSQLWQYTCVYEISEDSNRPLLKTIDTDRASTSPEFIYKKAYHHFVWRNVYNPHSSHPEVNPENTHYFEGDFNGDGISDMVFFNPETGYWRAAEGLRTGGYAYKIYGYKFKGYSGESKIRFFKGNVTGDYDGNGRSDIAFYLPETREFWVAEHTGQVFQFRNYGTQYITDIDIFTCEWFPGDYDGNGLSDTVLFNEPTGEWLLMRNVGGKFEITKFSQHFKNVFRDDYSPDANRDSDATVDTSEYGKDRGKVFFLNGDYNGDGRTDISLYDARTGTWFVGSPQSLDTGDFHIEWKLYKVFTAPEQALFSHDRFSGDFNGDGFSDFLLFDREAGEWILGATKDSTIQFSTFSRIPGHIKGQAITRWLQGDFNGDGRTDIGFYCPTDRNFWIGEATPEGFRYRIYNNLNLCPDPEKVLAAPLPKEEVKIKEASAVLAKAPEGSDPGKTEKLSYRYNGNYHRDQGEQVFPGYFWGSDPQILVYKRAENSFYLGTGSAPLPETAELT